MWRYAEAATSLFILWTCFQNSVGWRPFTMNIFNVSSMVYSAYSDKYYANVTVKENALSVHVQIKEEISNPMVRTEIYIQSLENGQYDVELMNRTIDVCTFLSNKLYEPLLQIGYRIAQDYGKVPHSCPIKKSSYHFVNVKPDAERFPMYLPERKAYLKLTFFKDVYTAICEAISFFEVKSNAGKRLKANGSR